MGSFFCARAVMSFPWKSWLAFIALVGGPGLGATALAQDCQGGFCPRIESPRQWPASPAIQQTPMASYHRAIVRVGRENLSEPGASYSGTGTFVARDANRGLVLTAAHVVEQGGGQIWVDFGPGRLPAALLGHDAPLDLAALVVERPPADVQPIPVAGENEWPRAGDTVEVVGYGGGKFRHFAANVRGYTAKELRNDSQLVVAFQPISGDSGGPILYKQKVAAILWGGPCDGPQQQAYETHATCCIYINRFLDGLGCRPGNNNPQQPPTRNPGGAAPPPVFVGPQPPVQPPAPSSSDARLAAIEQRLGDLADRLSRIGPGPAGVQGQPGPQGAAGPAGKDFDPAALSAIAGRVSALEKNLKGKLHFSLQVDPASGKILSTSSGSR
jgi:trypsin-like peptidase